MWYVPFGHLCGTEAISGIHNIILRIDDLTNLTVGCVAAYLLTIIQVHKTIVKPYLAKVGHGIMVLNPTSSLYFHFLHHQFSPKTRPHIVMILIHLKLIKYLGVMLFNVLLNARAGALG